MYMISTSSYQSINTNNNRTCSISGNRGKQVNYQGDCFPKLAPKRVFSFIRNFLLINEKKSKHNRFSIITC